MVVGPGVVHAILYGWAAGHSRGETQRDLEAIGGKVGLQGGLRLIMRLNGTVTNRNYTCEAVDK